MKSVCELSTTRRFAVVGVAGLLCAALHGLSGSRESPAGRETAFSARGRSGALVGRQQSGEAGAKAALVRAVAAWGSLQAVGPGRARDPYALASPWSRAALKRLARERFSVEPAYSTSARLPVYLIPAAEDRRTAATLRGVMSGPSLRTAEVAPDEAAMVAHDYARARRDAFASAPMLAAGISQVHFTRVNLHGGTAQLSATAVHWVASAQREPDRRLVTGEPSGPTDVTTTEVFARGIWTVRTFTENPPAGWSP